MRALGIDPGTLKLGWGIVEREGNRLVHVAHGVIALGLTPLVDLCHALVERGLGLAPVRIDAGGEAVAEPPGVADRAS